MAACNHLDQIAVDEDEVVFLAPGAAGRTVLGPRPRR